MSEKPDILTVAREAVTRERIYDGFQGCFPTLLEIRLAQAVIDLGAALENSQRLLGEAQKAVLWVSGPSHPLALEIRDALALDGKDLGGLKGGV